MSNYRVPNDLLGSAHHWESTRLAFWQRSGHHDAQSQAADAERQLERVEMAIWRANNPQEAA